MTKETFITDSDLNILAFFKENQEALFNFYSKKMGYSVWYGEFYDSNAWSDYTAKEHFEAADNLNKMDYFFATLFETTEFFNGLE